jgi:uncharacterized protein (TIGR00288 family)
VTADALILDFGGVLTPSVGRMFRDFERAHDLPKGTIFEAVARAYGDGGDDSPIARLERGELAVPDFERQLAGSLATAGHEVPADGLVERLHGRLEPSGPLWDATRIARDAGIRTGVLSNSWGVDSYPDGLMARFFDDVVISAAVGLRKPDPAIWHLACQRLDVAAGAVRVRGRPAAQSRCCLVAGHDHGAGSRRHGRRAGAAERRAGRGRHQGATLRGSPGVLIGGRRRLVHTGVAGGGYRAAMAIEPNEERLALFIDHENVAIGARDIGLRFDVQPLLDALAERGRLVVRRAYADWNLFREDRRGLVDGNIELTEIPQRSDSVRKNAADIQMAVDAMELAFTRDFVSTFVIVSGDSDFTPLVSKLRELNKRVIGVGLKGSTSGMLPPACDEFIFYDRLEGAPARQPPSRRAARADTPSRPRRLMARTTARPRLRRPPRSRICVPWNARSRRPCRACSPRPPARSRPAT